MPKYYVIPVDNEGLAYFGIKEAYSPYDHTPWYCGGCPQAFGGNDQGGIFETLSAEAREESHKKITLHRGSRYFKKVHEHNGMNFFVCTKFDFEPYMFVTQSFRQANKQYWETTGEVLKVDLDDVPTDTRANAGARVLTSYYRRSGRRPKAERINDFLTSETAEAIRKAAVLMKSGGLPVA